MPTDGDPSGSDRVRDPTTAESYALERGGAGVARLLVGLWREQRSGTLHLSGEGPSLHIRLLRGRIEAVHPLPPGVDFGEFLVLTGKLKQTDLELASRVMRETGQGPAQTLIEMGFASEKDMRELVAEHARSVVAPVLGWPHGTYRFEAASEADEAGFAAGLSPVEMILRVMREGRDPTVLWRGLSTSGLGLVWPDVDAPQGLAAKLNPSESLVLDLVRVRLDKVCWPTEIVDLSPLPRDETQRCLCALVAVGMLDVRDVGGEAPSSTAGAQSTAEGQEQTAPPRAALADVVLSAQSPAARRLGRHVVIEEIGRGAMGAVFLAKDPTIDRVVAIKVIQAATEMGDSDLEKYTTRFYQEARAAGKLLHPGIVTVFDVAHTADGAPYIVMEYVRGTTLRQLMKTGPLGLAEIRQISGEILDALDYAHGRGVIHRDVKPANVLVTLDGSVKIMDFGVAHIVGSKLTRAEEVFGTLSYMAPEQLSKGKVDRRADIFAFGILLYEMATGRVPFTGDTIFDIAEALVDEEPAPLHEVNADVPAALSEVVSRCIRKVPEQRFPTAAAVKTALLSALEGVAETPPEVLLVQSEGVEAGAPPVERRPRAGAARPAGRRPAAGRGRPSAQLVRRSALAAALLGAGGLLVLALLPLLRREEPSTTPVGDRPTISGTPAALPGDGERDGSEPTTSPPALANRDATPGPQAPGGDLGLTPPTPTPREAAANQVPPEPTPAEPPEASAGATEGGSGRLPVAAPTTDREMLLRALAQRESGDLEACRATLDALLRRVPDYPGAASLLAEVEQQLWRQNALPMVFRVRHKHNIGSCEGRLRLEEKGLVFESDEHGTLRWRFSEIRELERKDVAEIELRTDEKDILRLGGAKKYVFDLIDRGISKQDWERYQRLMP